MRILICASLYPPYRGGYAESVSALARGLGERGHAVMVIACGAETTVEGNVRIVGVPAWNPAFLHGSFPIPYPVAAWRAMRSAARESLDIISTQTRFFPLSLIGFLFAKAHHIPIAHTERGSAHPASHNPIMRLAGLLIDQSAGRLIISGSEAVIGVSGAACAFTRRLGARSPVRIPSGIDADFWKQPLDMPPRASSRRIAFAGRLVYAKGVQDLIAAFARIISEFPGYSLVIAGGGPYRPVLERLVRRLGMTEHIEFRGELDARGLREMLHRSALFINPSHSEGLPRAVLEAGAAGVPVIATDVGGTKEIIPNNSFGTLVPAHDIGMLAGMMRAAFADRDRSFGQGAALRARILGTFGMERSIGAHEEVMKRYVRDRG